MIATLEFREKTLRGYLVSGRLRARPSPFWEFSA